MKPERPDSCQASTTLKQSQDSDPQYDFFSVNNETNSLVALKKIPDVLSLLVIQPLLVVLNSEEIQQRLTDEKIQFLLFQDIQHMKKQIQSELKRSNIELVAPLRMVEEVGERLQDVEQIKRFHFHQTSDDQCDYSLLLMQISKKSESHHLISRLGKIGMDQVIESYKVKTGSRKIVKNKLPNIIHLNRDGWKASIQLRTMIAMINQKNTNKEKIMTHFYQLYHEVYGGSKIDYKEFIGVEEIIRKYTQVSSPENFLTNNLLRASKNPAEIYYCQPYFRGLFESISNLYKSQQENTKESLICYRGASASESEISNYKQNVGQIIQNLGFLSTSIDMKIGQKFAKNLMFVIEIKKEERDQELDFGYAKISQYSQFPDEQQILFNPLNTFQIQKIEKTKIKSQFAFENDQYIDTVYLTYGSLAAIRYRQNQKENLTQREKLYAAQAHYLLKGLKQRIENQGDAFISQDDYLQGGFEYWYKEMEHEHSQSRKVKVLYNMGMGNQFRGKYQVALDNYQECLRIQGEKYVPEQMMTLNNIGTTYQSMGKYKQAVKNLEKCLSLKEQNLGKMNPDYAITLGNIGSIKKSMGEYEEALSRYQKCLYIYQSALGKKHPGYATTLNNIGATYEKMDRYEEALKSYEECFTIYESVLGKKHPGYASILNNIGATYESMDRHQEALNNYQQSLIILKTVLGKNHPDYATTLGNIGSIYKNMGRHEEALENHKNCLDIREQVLGKSHPDYATALNNLGVSYFDAGMHQDALKNFISSLNILQKALGPSHPKCAAIGSNLRTSLRLRHDLYSLYCQLFSEEQVHQEFSQYDSLDL